MKHRSDAGRLASELAGLPGLDREALVEQWRKHYETEPPDHISRSLLIRAIAYRMQEKVYGGLKPATRRVFEKAVEDVRAGRQVTVSAHTAKPGMRLLREWHGVTHEVVVLENGVQFQGQRYQSLSEVARAITGTRWSGPLFFGLKKAAS